MGVNRSHGAVGGMGIVCVMSDRICKFGLEKK